jgi:CoA:oxalate CoA-transferase
MLDGLLSVFESVAMRALYTEEDVIPSGSHHSISAPFGTFETKDFPVAVAVANDSLFARLAKTLRREEWLEDPRFTDDGSRGRHRHTLQAEIEATLANMTREQVLDQLERGQREASRCQPSRDETLCSPSPQW